MSSGWPGASVETEVGPSLENVPLAAGSVREEAEWDQRVSGIDDYLTYGEQDGPDSDLIAERAAESSQCHAEVPQNLIAQSSVPSMRTWNAAGRVQRWWKNVLEARAWMRHCARAHEDRMRPNAQHDGGVGVSPGQSSGAKTSQNRPVSYRSEIVISSLAESTMGTSAWAKMATPPALDNFLETETAPSIRCSRPVRHCCPYDIIRSHDWN